MWNDTEMGIQADREYLRKVWVEDGEKVLEAIDKQNIKAITGDEFLSHCTACGGNWGGMLLTGIKALYPAVYEAIPNQMGKYAWVCICTILNLLQVSFAEEDK